MTKRRSAEIAGGGIAGLMAAAVLGNRGWTVRVHERAPELREIGAGIFIWENAIKGLEEIGALEELAKDWERVDNHELRDHRGRTLQSNWLRNTRLYTAKRTSLHRALANAAEGAGAELVTNSSVRAATPDGVLYLDSGQEVTADLVIGADGVHSRVRDSLDLVLKKVNLRDGCGRYLVPRLPGDPVNQTIEEWHGGRRLGIAPVSPDDVYLFLCAPDDDIEAIAQYPFDPESWARSYPRYREVLQRIPRYPEGRWAPFYETTVRSWVSGRVALLGDAAHSMAPNLGQAACVAMTNAISLGQALDRWEDVPTALQRWEASERRVSDDTQRYSHLYGSVGTHWPSALEGVRSLLIKTVGRSKRVQRRINAAATYYPTIEHS